MRKLPAGTVWAPVDYELSDAGALQALQRGDASAYQQQTALKFIVERIAGTYQPSFRATGDRDTCFAEGRRYVGMQIVKFLNINLATMKKETK